MRLEAARTKTQLEPGKVEGATGTGGDLHLSARRELEALTTENASFELRLHILRKQKQHADYLLFLPSSSLQPSTNSPPPNRTPTYAN